MILQDSDQQTLGLRILEAAVAADASGNAEITFSNLRGRLYAVELVSTDLDAGTDLTLVAEKHGTILTKTNDNAFFARPRNVFQDAAGADVANSAETIFLCDEDLVATIADAGNAKTGTLRIYLQKDLS